MWLLFLYSIVRVCVKKGSTRHQWGIWHHFPLSYKRSLNASIWVQWVNVHSLATTIFWTIDFPCVHLTHETQHNIRTSYTLYTLPMHRADANTSNFLSILWKFLRLFWPLVISFFYFNFRLATTSSDIQTSFGHLFPLKILEQTQLSIYIFP